MKQSQKLLIALLFLGALFITIIAIAFYKLNSGEFSLVEKQAHHFLELMSMNKYQEAYQYVDSSRISIKDLESTGNMAAHYRPGATYFNQSTEDLYIAGYKPVNTDKINDKHLEFIFSKVDDKWKVTRFSYY